jgi:hypothetical protein
VYSAVQANLIFAAAAMPAEILTQPDDETVKHGTFSFQPWPGRKESCKTHTPTFLETIFGEVKEDGF